MTNMTQNWMQYIERNKNKLSIIYFFLLITIPSEIIGAVRSGRPLRAHSLTYTTSLTKLFCYLEYENSDILLSRSLLSINYWITSSQLITPEKSKEKSASLKDLIAFSLVNNANKSMVMQPKFNDIFLVNTNVLIVILLSYMYILQGTSIDTLPCSCYVDLLETCNRR